jgi:antitoxin (DNA-binding transcriptional repressor) of toxin-antitoxin stability system
MKSVTFTEALDRFDQIVEQAKRHPIAIVRDGRAVAYIVCAHSGRALADIEKRRADAAQWYASYRVGAKSNAAASELTDEDIKELK